MGGYDIPKIYLQHMYGVQAAIVRGHIFRGSENLGSQENFHTKMKFYDKIFLLDIFFNNLIQKHQKK